MMETYSKIEMTRFPRPAVEKICNMLADDLSRPTARSNALPVETQVLAALQFYATGSFQWMVGRSCRVSQSSVSLAIDGVNSLTDEAGTQFHHK